MIEKIIRNHKYSIFFILGLVNSLPFHFDFFSIVSWFSFAPFLWLITKLQKEYTSIKKSFLFAFCFYFAYFFSVYSFFVALYPMDFVGLGRISSILVIAFAWLALSLLHSSIIALFTLFSFFVCANRKNQILSNALIFVIFEFILSVGPCAFPWARFSLPQSNTPTLIQTASFFGPYLIDFLLLVVNGFIAIAFIEKKSVYSLMFAILIFVVNLLLGVFCLGTPIESVGKADALIVQGNVLHDNKWKGSSSYDVYMNLTKTVDEEVDMIVWGETAVPTELNRSKKISKELEQFSFENNVEMIVGGFYSSSSGRLYNSAYYVNENGISNEVYFKRRLVPFGEYLPLRSLLEKLPFLDEINMLSYDLSPGNSTSVMNADNGKVGCLICFDSIFQNLARKSVKDGAELIVVITNDSWYKDYPAVFHHNSQSVWRAVENRRWVVRSANSGVSSFISPYGKIVSKLPPLTEGRIVESVDFIQSKTLYTKFGDIIVFAYLIMLLLIIINDNRTKLNCAFEKFVGKLRK